jgi:MFS family permease
MKKITDGELRLSLNLIIISVSIGMFFFPVVNGPPLTGFIRALGANDLVYSIIMALPMLSSIVQVFGAYIIENSGYRKLSFLTGGFLRILWIPAVLTPLLIPANHFTTRIVIVTILIAICSMGNAVVGVAFFSWAGSLIPNRIRGRYFATRAMIFTIPSLISGLLVGLFLDRLPGFGGYAILFSVVTLFGLADIACFIWVKEPSLIPPQTKIPLGELFWKPLQNRNYFKYLLFTAVWNFGINVAGPFFNVYMLEQLRMKFIYAMILAPVVANVSTILFVRVWGKIIDRYGNKPVLIICGTGMVLAPFVWCLATPHNFFLIVPLVNFLAGIFQPGCDIATTNLSMWLAPDKNRSIYIANYTLAAQLIGGGLAFICGGAFMLYAGPYLVKQNWPFLLGQPLLNFHSLFIIAALIRFIAIYCFMPRVKDTQSKGTRRLVKDFTANFTKAVDSIIIRRASGG